MRAINILELGKPVKYYDRGPISQSSAYSHAGDDECPVCKNKMVEAKMKLETVYFCPEHRITFPLREQ